MSLSVRGCGSNYDIIRHYKVDKVKELELYKAKWVYLKHKNEKKWVAEW